MIVKFTEMERKISLEELHEAEKRIGQNLPLQYKDFLLKNNGGRPEPSSFRIKWSEKEWAEGLDLAEVDFFLSIYDGDAANLLDYYDTFKDRIPNDTVAIADDPGGNLILLGTGMTNNGKIFYWMQSYEVDDGEKADYSNVGFVANSLNEFINSLFDD